MTLMRLPIPVILEENLVKKLLLTGAERDVLIGSVREAGYLWRRDREMKKSTVNVGGTEFEWTVYRQPRWTGDGVLLGLAILVKPTENSRRELVLEFAIERTRQGEMPQQQRLRVSNRRLIECIQNAMDAGWDPESRGKPFFFAAGAVE